MRIKITFGYGQRQLQIRPVEALVQAINYTTGMKFLFVLVVLLGITFAEDAVTIDQSTLENK